jgi:hypothetical protein
MKLSIEFRGLCAFVRDGANDQQTRNVDVLLVAAEDTDYSEHIHKPVLVFPLKNFRKESDRGSYSPFAIPDGKQWGLWSLRDRVVRLRLGGVAVDPPLANQLSLASLSWLPDMERAARTAAANLAGTGTVDPSCLSDHPAAGKKPVSARIVLGGGTLACLARVADMWGFHPNQPNKCYAEKFANRVTFTLETEVHDHVVFEATQFGTSRRRTLELQPRATRTDSDDGDTPGGEIRVSVTNFSSSSVGEEHPPHSLAYFDLSPSPPAGARPRAYKSDRCLPEVDAGWGEIGCSPGSMYAPGVQPDTSGWNL